MASQIPLYDRLVSKMFASRASFFGECASEFDIRVTLSSADSLRFILGSDDRPVSIAYTFGVRSSKHSSSESNPEFEPNPEKCGVHAWAGINITSGDASSAILNNPLLSSPSIGLPSAFRFPIFDSASLIRCTDSNEGAKRRLCTFLVFPFLLYIQLISAERTNRTSLRQDLGTSFSIPELYSGFSLN